jgi:tetratricopeptide (TPR) repeat protein
MKIYLLIFFSFIALRSDCKKDTIQNVDNEINNHIGDLERKLSNIEADKIEELVDNYKLTNDRINTQLTYISLISTIFGVILALGSIFIGFESIKSNKKRQEALQTLEEAKNYVNERKNEFDNVIKGKLQTIENEYKKVIELSKEQLIESLNSETSRIKEFAKEKTKEIEGLSLENKSDKLLEEFNRKIEFLESVGIPDDPEVLKSKISFLRKKEKYDDCIILAEKLVLLVPKSHFGFWELGYAYGAKGENSKSIENYTKVLELNPSDSSARNNLGLQYGKAEKYYDALREIDKAIELNPQEDLYYRNKGRILFILKGYNEVISSYRKAIEINPKKSSWYNEVIFYLIELNRDNEVIEFYDLAIKNLDENLELNFNKASYLYKMKQFEAAKEILHILIQSNFKIEDSYTLLALIESSNSNYSGAIEHINSAIALNAKNELLYYEKALILIKKDKKEAWVFIEDVGTSLFHTEVYRQSIAKKFAKAGFKEDAKQMYLKGLEIIKPKLSALSSGDIVNYFEGLIVTGQYSEADAFFISYIDQITNIGYKLVFELLNLISLVIQGKATFEENKISSILDYFKDNSNAVQWSFDDINIYSEEKVIAETLGRIKIAGQFMNGKTSSMEVRKTFN